MNKATTEIASAIKNGRACSIANTVATDQGMIVLHGNTILMKLPKTGATIFSLAGWNTRTTRSRLAPFVRLTTERGKVFAHVGERKVPIDPARGKWYALPACVPINIG